MKRIISMILVFVLCIGTTAVFADVDAENVTVIAEGKVLENGVDYTLTYRNNVDPGTATVVVSFIGNYAGMMERTFEIKKARRQSTGGGRGSGGNRIVITPTAEYASTYIMGYADGTFRPEAEITRAEAATAVARAANLEQGFGSVVFDDVLNHWAMGYVKTAADKEIVNGYEDGSFRPDNNITRAEFAKIIAMLTEKDISEKFTDFSDTKGHWAERYIAALAEKGMVTGYKDNTYHPDTPITRAEAVAMINRAVSRNCAPGLTMPFTDVTPEHWAYEEIVKAAGMVDGE